MRRAAKIDTTQADIVKALRGMGVAVLILAQVGNGCPDLLCWFRGVWMFVECKTPGRGLNKAQAEFIATWPGTILVVQDAEEACRRVAEMARPAA